MTAVMGRPTNRKRTKFGERIVSAREAAGLSQKDLADKLGISQRSSSWWERQNVALKPEQLADLAEALGVSADYLLGKDPKRNGGSALPVRLKRCSRLFPNCPATNRKKLSMSLSLLSLSIWGEVENLLGYKAL